MIIITRIILCASMIMVNVLNEYVGNRKYVLNEMFRMWI